MRFLADMGMSSRLVTWLAEQGHEAVHLRELGLQRLPDEAVFEKAATENRILLTFDLDFGEIAAFSRGRRCSVVVFRLRNTTTSFVIARLAAVLATASSALDKGAVVVVEATRHRIRMLPIGEES